MESPTFDITSYTNDVSNQLKIKISYENKLGKELIPNIPYDQPVKTISPHWLPIETLKDEYMHNPRYVQNIQNLSDKYCGWRKIRGDGNCYYRSVISIYMLRIFHFNDDQQRVIRLLGILRKIESSESIQYDRNIDQNYRDALNYIIQVLNHLYVEKNNSLRNFIIISNLLQDNEFDLKLIMVSRLLSYCAFKGPEGDFIKPFLDESEVEVILNRILSMGTEAEGVELSLCPLALDIFVKQVNVFETLLFNTFPIEDENEKNEMAKFIIHIICKSKGHYDSLYSIEDMEKDDYCLSENKYMIDETDNIDEISVMSQFYENFSPNNY
jgi:hypothetical protein